MHALQENKTHQYKCYTKFLKRFESQMSRLMNDFNLLKITS